MWNIGQKAHALKLTRRCRSAAVDRDVVRLVPATATLSGSTLTVVQVCVTKETSARQEKRSSGFNCVKTLMIKMLQGILERTCQCSWSAERSRWPATWSVSISYTGCSLSPIPALHHFFPVAFQSISSCTIEPVHTAIKLSSTLFGLNSAITTTVTSIDRAGQRDLDR